MLGQTSSLGRKLLTGRKQGGGGGGGGPEHHRFGYNRFAQQVR